jgi:hypothetical protein
MSDVRRWNLPVPEELRYPIEQLRRADHSMRTAALAYANLGLPVFPCHPDRKNPWVKGKDKGPDGELIPDTGGLYRATTNQRRISAWWSGEKKDAMIGLRMGWASGLYVVDIDANSEDDKLSLLETLEREIGRVHPPAWMVETPRKGKGGLHLYFAMPAELDLGNRVLIKDVRGKIETRGNRGYVIVPPSVRAGPAAREDGCDGVAYEWGDVALGDGPAPEMPRKLIALLLSEAEEPEAEKLPMGNNPKNRRLGTTGNRGFPSSGTAQERAEYRKRKEAEAAFDKEIAHLLQLSEGRPTALFQAACNLGEFISAGWLGRSEVEAAIERACQANGIVKKQGINAIRASIRSGLERTKGKPRDQSEIDREEVERGTRSRIPEPPPPEPDEGRPEPRRTDSVISALAKQTGVVPADAPDFPLPLFRGAKFAWKTMGGRCWLCSGKSISVKDPETGDRHTEIAWEQVCSPFLAAAWLVYAGEDRAAGLRVIVEVRGGVHRAVDFPRAILSRAGGAAILERLYAAGMLIVDEALVVKILKSADPETSIVIKASTGWHDLGADHCGQSVFACPDGTVIGAPEGVKAELDANIRIEAHYARGGTMEGWKEAIEPGLLNDGVPHLHIGAMAAFVGPLLKLAGFNSCGLDFVGQTSKGKTSAQIVAASAWTQIEANRPGVMNSAFSTLNAMENRLQASDGLVACIDELALLDGKAIAKLIFEISSGVGRARMAADGSQRPMRTWSTFAILSNERRIAHLIEQDRGQFTEGASLRIVEVDLSGLEKVDRAVFDALDGLRFHYGHAGPAFATALIASGWHKRGGELRREIQDLARELANGEPGEHEDRIEASPAKIRAGLPLALVWKAGELAKEFGVLPKFVDVRKAVRWAWDQFIAGADGLIGSPYERAAENLRMYVMRNWRNAIKQKGIGGARETLGWFDDDWVYLPAGDLEAAAGHILPQARLARELKERGLLKLPKEDGRGRNTVRLRPSMIRVYGLKRVEFGYVDEIGSPPMRRDIADPDDSAAPD